MSRFDQGIPCCDVYPKKMPSSGERSIRWYTKFDFTVDEGMERLNPSHEKNKARRRKVDKKSCVTFEKDKPPNYG